MFHACGKHSCKSARKTLALSKEGIAGIVIRFFLETALEFIIASMLGIRLKERILASEMTRLDTISYYSAWVCLLLISGFILGTVVMAVVVSGKLKKVRMK